MPPSTRFATPRALVTAPALVTASVLVTASLLVCATPVAAQQVVVPDGWRPSTNYAHAVIVDNTVHVSGITGARRDGPNDIESQTRRIFELLGQLLEAAGTSLEGIVSMTTYHVSMDETVGGFMSVKDEVLGTEDPHYTWTAVGIERLYSGAALVEVAVIAVVPSSD